MNNGNTAHTKNSNGTNEAKPAGNGAVNTQSFRNPARTLRRTYVIALSAVALLTIASQFLIRNALEKQEADGRVVNVAGQQRALSQKVSKLVLQLKIAKDADNEQAQERILGELKTTLDTWEEQQVALRKGSEEYQIPKDFNSEKVEQYYEEIDDDFTRLVQAARQVLADFEAYPGIVDASIPTIRKHSDAFLEGMIKIVNTYDKEAREKVNRLERIELGLLIVTLLTLLLEALFVFRPAVKNMEQLFDNLLQNTRKLQKQRKDLQLANKKLNEQRAEVEQVNENLQAKQNELELLNSELQNQQERLISSNKELEKAREETQQAYNELQETQSQIIQSEKMAALGQLIAGIAHEINTPIGAIRASVDNITDTQSQALQYSTELFKKLTDDELTQLMDLIALSINSSENPSSREERRYRRRLTKELEEDGVEDGGLVADKLVDMGIYQLDDTITPLLKHEDKELILDTAYSFAMQQKDSSNIVMAVDRVSKIIYSLKSYSRHNYTGEMTKANIIDGIETVLTLYHNQLKHDVEVIKNYDEIPDIYCYHDELNQIWTNLVHNSLQAMDNKGNLEISVSQESNYVVCRFTDSGKGIPQEIKDKIFQPFFTTKPAGEGSGLGLDIVKKIINKHDGQIDVDSEPGRTTFAVSIPIRHQPKEQETTEPETVEQS